MAQTIEGESKEAYQPGAFTPFRHKAFAVLWTATVASNVGTWMNDVGAGWLMTTMTTAPEMVALVQASTTLPVFLFALAAGALADLMDRRTLLIGIQGVMTVTALAMGLVTLWGLMTPVLLLVFTFLLGTGAAFVRPAWQAIVPELIPRTELASAVSLNSVGINVSRAIGPALGGLIIAGLGLAWPFLLNAVSFLGVIAALIWWRPAKAKTSELPRERFFGAVRAGVRHSLRNGPLRATLIRTVGFFIFSGSFWALLPLIAKEQLSGGPGLYGLLLGGIGFGAVVGALFMPRLRASLGEERLTIMGVLGITVTLVGFGLARNAVVGVAVSLLAGASWIAVLASLSVSAQVALPNWVRARGLSVFMMTLFGSFTLASIIWGQVAGQVGIPNALLMAAGGQVIGLLLTYRFKLHQGAALDLTPSAHWPTPLVRDEVELDHGPVMITIEYHVDDAYRKAFLVAMNDLEALRRQDGAYTWGLFEDAEKPGYFVEYMLEESWAEHLRTHERVSHASRAAQERVRQYLVQGEEPVIRHLLAANARLVSS